MYKFKTHFNHWYLEHILWNCPQVSHDISTFCSGWVMLLWVIMQQAMTWTGFDMMPYNNIRPSLIKCSFLSRKFFFFQFHWFCTLVSFGWYMPWFHTELVTSYNLNQIRLKRLVNDRAIALNLRWLIVIVTGSSWVSVPYVYGWFIDKVIR